MNNNKLINIVVRISYLISICNWPTQYDYTYFYANNKKIVKHLYKYFIVFCLNRVENKNRNKIKAIKNKLSLKYLFCFFVLSTKLSYSSSIFVLLFILYVYIYL